LGPLWLEAFAYNRWANLQLLDACARLTDEQLELGSPGTYGTIAATLQHLAAAEQRYVKQLGGPEAGISEADEFPGVTPLRELFEQSGNDLLAIAERLRGEDSFERQFRGHLVNMTSGVVAIQALHHGNDHRTHIGTILGQNNIDVPLVDVWEYGLASGYILPVEPITASG
jgi:uncharacterized damage-inducible protein DinB